MDALTDDPAALGRRKWQILSIGLSKPAILSTTGLAVTVQ